MAAIVTPLPMFVKGVKIGEATQGNYTINNGVGQSITNDGPINTVGTTTVSGSITEMIKKAGNTQDFSTIILSKADCNIQIPVGAKRHTFVCKFTTYEMSWDHAAGTATGTANFVGETPDLSAV